MSYEKQLRACIIIIHSELYLRLLSLELDDTILSGDLDDNLWTLFFLLNGIGLVVSMRSVTSHKPLIFNCSAVLKRLCK